MMAHLATRRPATPPSIPSSRLSVSDWPIEPATASADRGANRHLSTARCGPGEQQVCHVHAGDEQDERHGAEQKQGVPCGRGGQNPRPAEIRTHCGSDWRRGTDATALRRLDPCQPVLVPTRHFGLQSGVNLEKVIRACRCLRGSFERERGPQLNRAVGKLERPRQHADDVVRDAVQDDLLPDDRRVGTEPTFPESMVQHHDAMLADLALPRVGTRGRAPARRAGCRRMVSIRLPRTAGLALPIR